jgi:hypothetical protein
MNENAGELLDSPSPEARANAGSVARGRASHRLGSVNHAQSPDSAIEHPPQVTRDEQDDKERKIKLSIEVTPELNRVIERIAAHTGATKSDAVRKAIVLMDVAIEAKENGERLFVGTEPPRGTSREIIGL